MKKLLLLVLPFFFMGCALLDKEDPKNAAAKDRTLINLEKDGYTFFYPEEYEEDTILSSDRFPAYTHPVFDSRITVTPEEDYPKDGKLDDNVCKEIEDVVKLFDDDVVVSNSSFKKDDVQGCDIQTTSAASYDNHIDYKVYHKIGDTVLYRLSITYPKDTPQIEIDNLKKSLDAFVIK